MIKLTAIVSTYNSEMFIRGCLEDLLEQTLYKKGELEILVIDSNSQQNEKRIVEELQHSYGNISYYRTNERISLYAAWNMGARLAQGKYLTNANTDDRHRFDSLQLLTDALDADQSIDLVYADYAESSVPNEPFHANKQDVVYHYPEYFPPLCLLHFQFSPAPVWRKVVHEKIGFFDEKLLAVGDLDFNIRFAIAGLKAKKVPQILGLFYANPGSITNSLQTQQAEKAQVLSKYRNEPTIVKLYMHAGWKTGTKFETAAILNNFGIRALAFPLPWSKRIESDVQLAGSCLNSAAKYFPDSPELYQNLAEFLKVIKNQKRLEECRFYEEIPIPTEKSNHVISITNQALRLAFYAGDLDNFSFVDPFINYLKNRNFVIEKINMNGLTEERMVKSLADSDLLWCEWGNGPIIPISHQTKQCPLFCRIHRYEAYEVGVTQINWYNVDKLLLVNDVYLKVIEELWDRDISKKTDVKIIPNAVSRDLPYRPREKNFDIAYISRFQKDKNPALMVQVLVELLKRDNRYHIHMVGRVQDQVLYMYCNHLLRELGIASHFSYEGLTTDVPGWLDNKSFLLSTSIVESQGLGIMEAMMMGIKPVIHDSFGNLGQFYSKELFFRTADEAASVIHDGEYNSSAYRAQIESKYCEDMIFPQIESLMLEEIKKYRQK